MRSDIARCRGESVFVSGRRPRGLPALAAVLAGMVALLAPSPARASDDVEDGLAAQVTQVFGQKCAACHSPQAKKVKKFGYITDLSRLAANPKLVVPRDPASSGVWTAIDQGEMPPEDAPQLTGQEKDVVRKWIEAGAPAGHPAIAAATTDPSTRPAVAGLGTADGLDGGASAEDVDSAAAHAALPFGRRLVLWLGKFHPMVVHFPIALICVAALAELAWLKSRSPWLTGAVRAATALAAISAVASGALGWVNAASHTSSALLAEHRWLGTAAVAWMLPLVVLCEWGTRRGRAAGGDPFRWAGRSRVAFQVLLFAAVALVGVAAHMGGALSRPDNYFRF